jgi:hypothetical protein
MVNKEKLLLLATIYMLVPGAMPDVLADGSEGETVKTKKSPPIQKVQAKKEAKLYEDVVGQR